MFKYLVQVDYTEYAIYPLLKTQHLEKCTQKPVLNVRFKDVWYTKINETQNWYDKFI